MSIPIYTLGCLFLLAATYGLNYTNACFQVIICCLVAVAAARPQQSFDDSPIYEEPQVKTLEDAGILRMESTMSEDGSFKYGFETTDPMQQDVAGQIKQIGEKVGVVMQGSYSYESPEGETITINWVADEGGFRATGDAIPVAPEDTNAAAQAAALEAAPAFAPQSDVLFSAPARLTSLV